MIDVYDFGHIVLGISALVTFLVLVLAIHNVNRKVDWRNSCSNHDWKYSNSPFNQVFPSIFARTDLRKCRICGICQRHEDVFGWHTVSKMEYAEQGGREIKLFMFTEENKKC